MYLELVLVVVVSFTVINHIEAAAAESEDILDCSSSILLPKYSAAVNKMDFFLLSKAHSNWKDRELCALSLSILLCNCSAVERSILKA